MIENTDFFYRKCGASDLFKKARDPGFFPSPPTDTPLNLMYTACYDERYEIMMAVKAVEISWSQVGHFNDNVSLGSLHKIRVGLADRITYV